ncbi:MAG: hypothetical protein ABSE73_05015, partial [Planctomycetota bacterium]
ARGTLWATHLLTCTRFLRTNQFYPASAPGLLYAFPFPSSSYTVCMGRLAAVLLCLAIGAACAEDNAPAEVPAALTTPGGSRLLGLLANDKPLVCRTGKGTQKLGLTGIKSILFGERFDPNLENEARLAAGDLQSDKFDTREKALAKLRSLGHASFQALKDAAASADPEASNRAQALLAEMGLLSAAAAPGDSVVLAEGPTVQGLIQPTELTLRSRWGRLKFSPAGVESFERLLAEEVNLKALAPSASPVTAAKARDVAAGANKIERLAFPDVAQPNARAGLQPNGLFMITMDSLPNQDRNAPPGRRLAPAKAGDKLEDAFAAWGLLLRPVDPKAAVQAAPNPGNAPGPKLLAQVDKSDCEAQFVLPGSYNAKTGAYRAGAVTMLGVLAAGEDDVGLAAYDRNGRQLGEIYSQHDPLIAALPGKFVGLRSTTPIARVRLFRTGAGKNGDLLLEGLIFDRIAPNDRPPGAASVLLSSGERLVGQLTAAGLAEGLALRPDFLDEHAAPLQVPLDEVERFEPAHGNQSAGPQRGTGAEEKTKRVLAGTLHGVLLQNGESFRACLLKLEETTALFLLPGGAELKLPRTILRKIDLEPEPAEPGELPAPVAAAKDEKPGVDFKRRKESPKEEPKPKGDKQPIPKQPEIGAKPGGDRQPISKQPEIGVSPRQKKDVLQNTQELEPMPNVEILELDLLAGELKIKDDNGEMTIGLPPVKTLVFPKDPNAQPAGAKRREWVLTLRQGSRFEISLNALAVEALTADMTGSTVTLPWEVIEALERRRKP